MKYAFFPGCSYHTAAGYRESVDAVNAAIGLELEELPDWNCCGATAFFSTDKFKAMALVARIFGLAEAQGFREIVTVCNACYTTLRKAKEMLSAQPESAVQINNRLISQGLRVDSTIRIRHYLDVLANDVSPEVWSGCGSKALADLSVAGYYGCQLTRPWKDLGDPEQPTILDRFIQRLGFKPVNHSAKTLCCGASHAVAYENECRSLVSGIIREVHARGADLIATVCPLCQFNLDAGQRNLGLPLIPVPFFTQLAGLALGLEHRDLGLDKLLIPLRRL